jgi:hypothetical protein
MKDSTPSLQAIYLEACREFDELTNKLLQGFSAAVDSALMSYAEQQSEALQRSTGASESQDREIAGCLKESLQAITQSVEQTIGENEQFLERLREEISINCRSLQQEVTDLSESLQRSHSITSKVLLAKLSGQCDKSIDGVQQTSNRSKQTLREQSQSVSTQFGESLLEKQGRQFADLMSLENQARKEIPDMLSAIIGRSRLHEPRLAMLNRQHSDQIDGRIEQLRMKVSEVSDGEMSRIIAASSGTEQKMRRTYEEIRGKVLAANKAFTEGFTGEVEETNKKSRLETADLVSALRAEMMDSLNEATGKEGDRSQKDIERARQLAEELLNLIEDQRLIAAQKTTVVAQIMSEMKEIETSFENKVERMSAAQLDRLSQTCNSAMNEITITRKSVGEKIQSLSQKYLQQIDEEEERILSIIERRLEKALSFIDQAVGED